MTVLPCTNSTEDNCPKFTGSRGTPASPTGFAPGRLPEFFFAPHTAGPGYTRSDDSPHPHTGSLYHMNTATRRQFLQSSLLAGTGLTLGAASAAAIEPIRRSGPPHLRLSIAAYSFRQALELKRKPKPAMTL